MRILVTGALGHIGSKLIRGLESGKFEEVCLIDNLCTQRYASLFNLPQEFKFNFIEEDICSAELDKYFKGIDVVIHLAAITDATTSFERKDQVEKVNFFGTEKVARACLKNGCRLFFPSTTSVYGSQDNAVDETCPLSELKPQSPYAESKLRAENLLIQLGNQEKLRFVIFRLGTIFGSSVGMRFHTAVNKFIWQAVLGQDLTVWKTAIDQKRPYCDLRDCVNAINHTINADIFDGNIYNLVTINLTVRYIIDSIKRYIPDTKIKFVDSQVMNQLSYNVSNEKSLKRGFRYFGDIDSSVKETILMLENMKSLKSVG